MTDTNPDIDHAAIERHYAHACAKHPHFCDMLFIRDNLISAKANLAFERHRLADSDSKEALQILSTEVAEIVDAYARHDYAAAIEECHDAIAVLLRMAKMIADECEEKCAKEGEVAK